MHKVRILHSIGTIIISHAKYIWINDIVGSYDKIIITTAQEKHRLFVPLALLLALCNQKNKDGDKLMY